MHRTPIILCLTELASITGQIVNKRLSFNYSSRHENGQSSAKVNRDHRARDCGEQLKMSARAGHLGSSQTREESS